MIQTLRSSSGKMAVRFIILSNVAFTTSVSINKIEADLFIKGIFKLEQGVKFTFRSKTQQTLNVDPTLIYVEVTSVNEISTSIQRQFVNVDSSIKFNVERTLILGCL